MLDWNAVLEAPNGLECQIQTDRDLRTDSPAFFFSESALELFWRRASEATEAFEGLGGWTPIPTNQRTFTWFCSCC